MRKTEQQSQKIDVTDLVKVSDQQTRQEVTAVLVQVKDLTEDATVKYDGQLVFLTQDNKTIYHTIFEMENDKLVKAFDKIDCDKIVDMIGTIFDLEVVVTKGKFTDKYAIKAIKGVATISPEEFKTELMKHRVEKVSKPLC